MNDYVVVPVELSAWHKSRDPQSPLNTTHNKNLCGGVPFTAEDPENYRLGHDWLISFQFSVVHGQFWLVTFPWLLEDTAFDCILLQCIWGAADLGAILLLLSSFLRSMPWLFCVIYWDGGPRWTVSTCKVINLLFFPFASTSLWSPSDMAVISDPPPTSPFPGLHFGRILKT